MTDTVTPTTSEPEPIEPPARPASARRTAARAAWIGAWAVVAVVTWVAFSRFASITFPARFTVLLQALVPIVFVPVYAIGVVAFIRRRWPLGAACVVLAAIHLAAVVPALGSRPLPAWAATSPRVSILEANVYDENAEPEAAARKILASGADVVVLVEMDFSFTRALRAQGIDQAYPYSTLSPGRYRADAIWSKLPLHDVHVPSAKGDTPSATVDVGGRSLRLVAVHVDNAIRGRDIWSAELAALGRQAHPGSGPVALVGDFNATRWNPPFGDLLGRGFHDAHEAVGQGLSRSWPNLGFVVPVMRLDHALVNDGVGVVSVHDVDVPGSDHVGFQATLAVGT